MSHKKEDRQIRFPFKGTLCVITSWSTCKISPMEARNVKAGDVIDQETIKHPWNQTAVIDQETIKHPWNQTALASAFSASALCEICPCLFIVVCQSPIYISLSIFMVSKQDWLALPSLLHGWGHTPAIMLPFGSGACQQSVLEGADNVSIAGSCLQGRSAPAGRSLRRTVRFAFPARVSLLPRRGDDSQDDSHFGARKRIWQRGLGRALPFLSFLMPDLTISSSEELVPLVFCLKRKEYKTNKNFKKKTLIYS